MKLTICGLITLWFTSLIGPFALAQSAQSSSPNAQSKNNQNTALEAAASLNAQVVKLFREGKYDEALPLAKRAVELREKELGEDHELVGAALFNLGMVYLGQKRYESASATLRRTLKINEKRLGKEHPDLYPLLFHLGWANHAVGNPADTEAFFKRALAIREKQAGLEHPDLAGPLENLASFYQKIGNPETSLPLYQRIIAIQEKHFGPEAQALVETLEKCACALRQGKKVMEAGELEQRAAQIAKRWKPDTVTASGGVLQGFAIHKEQPRYPDAAKAARLSGAVFIKVVIDEVGKVTDATIICGADLLAVESREAARKWRFKPTMVEGKPVKVQGILTFNFTLQ